MAQRRDFFRQLVGHLVIARDNIKGAENIPLKRLNELPENIIEQIEPVFFPEEVWQLRDHVIYIPESKFSKIREIELNEIELIALRLFLDGTRLKNTAIQVAEQLQISMEITFPVVSALFFRLASLRLCHPREVYHFDELIKTNP